MIQICPKRSPQALGNDRGGCFILYTHAPCMTFNACKFITSLRVKCPITIHDAGMHTVLGLLCVFLALVLRYFGQKVFNKHRGEIFSKFNRRAFRLASCIAYGCAQVNMCIKSTGGAVNHVPVYASSLNIFVTS